MKKNARKPAAPSRDLYAAVTDRIVAALEAGTKPWRQRWSGAGNGGAMLRANGQEYRGINQLLLMITAMEGGYTSPYWITFKQALELGGAVRKGERSTEIVFYKKLTITDRNAPEGEESEKQIPLLRSYRVFNVEQCDGLPERFNVKPAAPIATGPERDERAEAALRSSGAVIREGGNKAFYAPGPDVVQMPPLAAFDCTGSFLATLAHELTHWTGHRSRLARKFGGRFGSHDYAREELVAEIGAAFICARLEIAGEHLDDHASYLASWLKVLREDKRAIFQAAALAQSAADLVLVNAGTGAAIEEAPEELEEVGQDDRSAAELEPVAAAAPAQLELLAA